jgi:hypothetical protein
VVFTKRERIAAIAALLGVGLLVGDQFVLEPYLRYRGQIQKELDAAKQSQVRAEQFIKNQPRVAKEWHDMQIAGLKDTASDAESQLQDYLTRWGNETGLTLTSSRQDRPLPEKDKMFQEIVFRASANGSMAAIAQMLSRIETSKLPVRVTAITITPRKEATDDLSVQITLSTLCQAPTAESDNSARTSHGGTP